MESSSEKANTSSNSIRDTGVDRLSRHRVSVSRSPSPYRSPGPYRPRGNPRDGSRSPYRESRGSKRQHDDDHYDRSRNDPRRFKVRYEDSRPRDRGSGRPPYGDLDRKHGRDQKLSYGEERNPMARPTDAYRHGQRDRTPPPLRGHARSHDQYSGRGGRPDGPKRGFRESGDRLPNEQSVSDRGHNPVAAAQSKCKAETNNIQAQAIITDATSGDTNRSAKYVPPSALPQDTNTRCRSGASVFANDAIDGTQPAKEEQLDEAALIEERRKRREAIKAKHKGQATPLLVQALALDSKSTPTTPKTTRQEETQDSGKYESISTSAVTDNKFEANSRKSPPNTPKEVTGQESPNNFVVTKDTDLANNNADPNASTQEDEPSAADYDPTMDMQEDQMRHDHYQRNEEVSASGYDETKQADQDVLVPDALTAEATGNEADDGFDMFAEGNDMDMFAEAPATTKVVENDKAKAVPVPQAKAIDMGMLDDGDDPEGYYKVILGELLDNRYHVQSNLGKGMFSGVVRATDQKTKRLVAIKVIRNNETMKRAGYKEIDILQALNTADPEDRKHVIRLERCFEHKGHLCMVFENLSINLREVLKKFGRDVGINLKAVRAYAQQMFLGLSLLRKCNVLHADLKPDNVLVNESRNMLKICDLGSASDASENEITQYLVSRFYRAPEIILGMPYDFAIDMWSIGCTLFELYTGKILFTGRSNNQMLRAIMECRGKFSHKILRKAQFAGYHFDDLLNFRSVEKDRLSGKDTIRVLNLTKPTRDLKTRLMGSVKGMNDAETKEVNLFVDLLERCLNLNPEKRCTPAEALKHPFIMRQKAG